MAKQKEYNSDWMSRKQDEQLEQIERNLSALYANAAKEVNAEFARFTETFKAKDAEMQKKLDAGEITDTEYSIWRQRNVLQTDMYKATVDKLTDTLTKADQAAMAMVNGELPKVVAESYNFTQALGWQAAEDAGMSVGTFQIYNAKSVEKIVRDNPDLLKNVDVPEDTKWNKDHINREITTGIIKGESIPKVANRLQRVTNMDKNAAVRNARTSMTYAENLGRSESADDLHDKGIPVQEVWSATHDEKTRETHILLDGTVRDEDGYFGAGILNTPLRCPADPDGDSEEIYNCRCRLSIVLKGIDHSQDRDLYAKFMQENDPEAWAKVEPKIEAKEAAFQANKEKAEAKQAEKQAEKQPISSEQRQIPVMPENVRQGYDKFEQKYIDAKVEHGMLYSKDGELLSQSQSKRGESVSIATESTYQNLAQGAFEIHNHTADELYSWKDIYNYDQYGMNGTITIPSGWEYTLYNTKEPRWDWDDTKRMETEDQWLSVAWHKAQDEINDEWREERRSYIDSLQGLERDEQRRLLRQWEEQNSRIERQSRWLEEHAEAYGFIFERKKVK